MDNYTPEELGKLHSEALESFVVKNVVEVNLFFTEWFYSQRPEHLARYRLLKMAESEQSDVAKLVEEIKSQEKTPRRRKRRNRKRTSVRNPRYRLGGKK